MGFRADVKISFGPVSHNRTQLRLLSKINWKRSGKSYEPESKLLKGGYMGDYIGNYYRGYLGGL